MRIPFCPTAQDCRDCGIPEDKIGSALAVWYCVVAGVAMAGIVLILNL